MKYKIEASRLLFFRTGAELLRFALLVFFKIIIILQFVFGFVETNIYFYT